jgi:oligosaccharide repeat unit polymerase
MEVSGSEYETSLGYFRMLVNFASPAFFIAFVFFLVSKRRLISYLGFFIIILGFLNIAFSFFVSSRGGVVFFILNILVVLSIYNRINIKSILLGTLFAGLLFSAMTTLRPSTTSNIDQVSFNIFDPIIVNRNLLDISVTSKIYNEVPEQLEFQYGSTFLSLFVAPVPRTYWPSKPAVNPGKTIADELYSFDPNSQAGVPPGIIGELFINFGILGVFTGLLLLGIIIKKIYLYFNFESIIRKNKVILYIAVIMNVTVILFGGSINQALISFLQEFIILYMGLKFISIDINDLVSVNSDS